MLSRHRMSKARRTERNDFSVEEMNWELTEIISQTLELCSKIGDVMVSKLLNIKCLMII